MVVYFAYTIKDGLLVATAFDSEEKAKAYVAVNPDYKLITESYYVR